MNSWLDLVCKTTVFKGVLDALPNHLPFIRELRIQNEKLNRMLMSPPWKGGPPSAERPIDLIIFGDDGKPFRAQGHSRRHEWSVKKYNKAKGKYAAKVGAQAKKVQKLADQSFKQYFRQTKQITTNAEFRHWKAKFEDVINHSADRMQNQVSSAAVKFMGQRSSKPFGRIGSRS